MPPRGWVEYAHFPRGQALLEKLSRLLVPSQLVKRGTLQAMTSKRRSPLRPHVRHRRLYPDAWVVCAGAALQGRGALSFPHHIVLGACDVEVRFPVSNLQDQEAPLEEHHGLSGCTGKETDSIHGQGNDGLDWVLKDRSRRQQRSHSAGGGSESVPGQRLLS